MRLSVVALVCLLVVDIVGAVAVFKNVYSSPSIASGETAPRLSGAEEDDERLRVAVFGDSFAAGAEDDSERSWVQLLAEDEDWAVNNLAKLQKGYDSFGRPRCGGSACDSALSSDEIAAIGSPDLILVSGGRWFLEQPPSSDRMVTVKTFFRQLMKSFPQSDVAALNPLWGSTTPPSIISSVSADIEAFVSKLGGTFLDVGQPLVGKPDLIDRDTGRPNGDGHVTIARAVASSLSEAGLAT